MNNSKEPPKTETKPTVNICLDHVSGGKLYSIVKKAIDARSRSLQTRVSISDFCDVSGISRTQLYGYRRGENPGADGVVKIASGLKTWGYTVTINF